MGTGIVSVALLLDGHTALSDVLLWIAIALACVFAVRGARRAATPAGRARLRELSRHADALTTIAGPCVIGTRLVIGGHRWPGIAVLVAAVPAWSALLPTVLRAMPRRLGGGGFLIAVATQSPAVLAATLADRTGAAWLDVAALAFAVAGLALYFVVLARFDRGALRTGLGGHWVAGGALAISTLAVADVVGAEHGAPSAGDRAVVAVLWIAAMAWLVPLVIAELRWPRPQPDPRRWSTIFPLGMYAVMSFAAATVTGWGAAEDFARVETWVAAAAWAALALAGAAHVLMR